MEILLIILIIALICGGFSLYFSANRYKKEGATGIQYSDSRNWFVPIWKAGVFRQKLKPEGYKRFLIGWIMIALGAALSVVYFSLNTGRL